MERNEVIFALKKLAKKDYAINYNFTLGKGWVITPDDLTGMVNVQMPDYNNTAGKAQEQFTSILKEVYNEADFNVTTDDLGYEDSLRFLYHHFPYGKRNSSNSVLTNGCGDVIAIQWNGCDLTERIISTSLSKRDKIVLNNCKEAEIDLKYKDFEEFIPALEKLFNK